MKGRGSSFWGNVRWIFLAPSLVAIAVGIGLLFTPIPEETRYFLAGALIGIGGAGAIGELAWTFERAELRRANAELRQPILSQCLSAYRMGEFFLRCYEAWLEGDIHDRHVTEFLDASEPLAIRRNLESLLADDPTTHSNPYEHFMDRVTAALGLLGQHAVRFFRFGHDLATLRELARETSDGGIAARMTVTEKTTSDIESVTGSFSDPALLKAWRTFTTAWEAGRLIDQDVDHLLLAIHRYVLVLLVNESGSDDTKRELNSFSASLHKALEGSRR